MTTNNTLRDPRTFRVLPDTDRPGTRGGIHFPKDDAMLAAILAGERLGVIPNADQEHYYPGDIIRGRLPVSASGVLLARRRVEVVEAGRAATGASKGRKGGAADVDLVAADAVTADDIVAGGEG